VLLQWKKNQRRFRHVGSDHSLVRYYTREKSEVCSDPKLLSSECDNETVWRCGGVAVYNCEVVVKYWVNAKGTPRKLATATQPQFPYQVTCVQPRLITVLGKSSNSEPLGFWRWCIILRITGFSEDCYQPGLNTCYLIRKLRLRCGFQFHWFALGLTVWRFDGVKVWRDCNDVMVWRDHMTIWWRDVTRRDGVVSSQPRRPQYWYRCENLKSHKPWLKQYSYSFFNCLASMSIRIENCFNNIQILLLLSFLFP
jgi:hypothetical protein